MAQTIVIEQGDKDLNDVTKITPDTKVNYRADVKYPATDLNNGMVAETWEEDGVTFTNPHAIGSDPTEESGS